MLDITFKRLAKHKLRRSDTRLSLVVYQNKAEAEAELQRNHATMWQEEADDVYRKDNGKAKAKTDADTTRARLVMD